VFVTLKAHTIAEIQQTLQQAAWCRGIKTTKKSPINSKLLLKQTSMWVSRSSAVRVHRLHHLRQFEEQYIKSHPCAWLVLMAYQRKSRGENIYLFEFSTCSHRVCYFIGVLSFSNANKPIISQIIFNIPKPIHSLIKTG